jgi:P pilus assembly chaperone PapD
MRTGLKILVFAGAVAAGPVLAGIGVSPSVVIFEPTAKQETVITVTNDGDRITYVTTEAREVTARGETDEKLRTDPDPVSLGLVATPARLVLEKGERRGVRILAVNPPGALDRVWRVKIAPVAGRVKAGQSGVAFQIGYDTLIIQRAADATIAVVGVRHDNQLTLTNSGNSFAMIYDLRLCPTTGECVKLPDTKRLYGQSSWSVNLPQQNGAIEVTVEGLNGKKDVLKF